MVWARDALMTVDDAEALEPRARGLDAKRREVHHTTLPLCFVLVTIKVEVVHRRARDR
jgi:hypothetical protein